MYNISRSAHPFAPDATADYGQSRRGAAHRRPSLAPRTRVVERFSQSPRAGRIVSVRRNGLAIVQWSDGSTSAQVTFALMRATEAR